MNMNLIRKDLKEYIEREILPIYELNESGHGIKHIEYVIRRSIEFASQFSDIDLNMVYTIAAFHDIGHHINKDEHEVLSAKIFYENEKMKEFFNDEQRKIIKEAIEDHRASLKTIPRSDYGKIVSSADRSTSISSMMQRIHSYSLKHHPNYTLEEHLNHAKNHIREKFGKEGYSKTYCDDPEYEEFIKNCHFLLEHPDLLEETYLKENHIEKENKRNLHL